jgi:RimJ/RimL family protein N-acetyltransferase
MGWRLSRTAWGQGYATEAARLALADGFGRCSFERVVATVQPANDASCAVVRKLGMTELVDLRSEGLLVYAISAETRAGGAAGAGRAGACLLYTSDAADDVPAV